MIRNRHIFVICIWLFLSLCLALLDFSTKYWIKKNLLMGEIFKICPGFNYHYISNSGVAFGLLSNMGIYFQRILTGLIIFIIVVFCVFLYKSVLNYLICESLSYSIIIGGAVGNLYDRLCYGSVVDFIDLYITNWHWPIFNVADMEICFGVILLIMCRYIH